MNAIAEVPKTAVERGKIAPIKFAHIVFQSARADEMIAWYKRVLEAEVMFETPMITFLTYDEEHHRVAIGNLPHLQDRPARATGVAHCAFTYASFDELAATYERLLAEGIEPYWCVNHGPTLSIYYHDPDKNQIELQIDIHDTNEATNAWFAQSDFESNPIGVTMDMPDLIQKRQSGESLAQMLERPVIDTAEVFNQLPVGMRKVLNP